MAEDEAPSLNDEQLALYRTYLSATDKQRSEQFADTARAAQITGLSRRTILVWIESGKVLAIRIGHKHQVSLKSLNDYLAKLS